MKPSRQTVTGVDVSAPVPLNTNTSPFNVTVGVVLSDTGTYTVQYTVDPVFDPAFDPDTATWFDHPDMTDLTASALGNIAFPVTGVRVDVTASTGAAEFVVIQAGIQ